MRKCPVEPSDFLLNADYYATTTKRNERAGLSWKYNFYLYGRE